MPENGMDQTRYHKKYLPFGIKLKTVNVVVPSDSGAVATLLAGINLAQRCCTFVFSVTSILI